MKYTPSRTEWAATVPADAGFDPAGLADAIAFHQANETPWPHDIDAHIKIGHFEPPPWNEIIGPTRERTGPNGIVLRGGRIVAEWGDTARADMTFSVTKSYLALVCGLAVDDGLISDIDRPVGEIVKDGGFDSAQNRPITWRHLLEQTSEWEGELFGKPDMVDRNRNLATEGAGQAKGTFRALQPPGAYWEYNDVRVNRLSLSLLRVFKRAVPAVAKERIMDPIGASDAWEWHGYRTSEVEESGKKITSVSGGGHWGGGLFIPTRDHARVGLMVANHGRWGDRRIISEDWIRRCATPSKINASYGLLFWLNTDGTQTPSAPRSSVFMLGAGSNIVWIDRDHDLVAVVRWIAKDAFDGFARRVLAALR
ncbi:MAG: class C beta-lactamase-related serine hydrolase [Alphaproteobacteria bacterium]|nr:class C beta-lactamase-related serine hydrolase [Alphaproteobacteria bacterium]